MRYSSDNLARRLPADETAPPSSTKTPSCTHPVRLVCRDDRVPGASTGLDPTDFPKEREDATRARHATEEWGTRQAEPIQHDDYTLDGSFGPYESTRGRQDTFSDEYEDLPVFVTRMEHGLLFGQEFLVSSLDEPTVSNERLYLANLSNITEKLDQLTQREVPADTVYLVGANAPHVAFYHWCFQCLPAIALLRFKARTQGLKYKIVLPPLGGARERSLQALGVRQEECIELDSNQYLAGVPLMYTNVTCADFTFQPSNRLIRLLDDLKHTCLSTVTEDTPRKIFISRKDAPRKRALVNEQDLSTQLQQRGFSEIVMSDQSLDRQIALFANADVIVASHGAALVNLMFCREGTRVVEVMADHYRHACFFRIAQARKLQYRQVVADMHTEDERERRHGSKISVDVAKLIEGLEQDELR